MDKCKKCGCALPPLEDVADREAVARADYASFIEDGCCEGQEMPNEASFVAWQVERFSPNCLWVCDECAETLQRLHGFDTDFWPIREEALVALASFAHNEEQK